MPPALSFPTVIYSVIPIVWTPLGINIVYRARPLLRLRVTGSNRQACLYFPARYFRLRESAKEVYIARWTRINMACSCMIYFRGVLISGGSLHYIVEWVNHWDRRVHTMELASYRCPLFRGVHKAGYQFHCKLCAE